MGTYVLGTIGTTIGGPVGGAIGAMLGSLVDRADRRGADPERHHQHHQHRPAGDRDGGDRLDRGRGDAEALRPLPPGRAGDLVH